MRTSLVWRQKIIQLALFILSLVGGAWWWTETTTSFFSDDKRIFSRLGMGDISVNEILKRLLDNDLDFQKKFYQDINKNIYLSIFSEDPAFKEEYEWSKAKVDSEIEYEKKSLKAQYGNQWEKEWDKVLEKFYEPRKNKKYSRKRCREQKCEEKYKESKLLTEAQEKLRNFYLGDYEQDYLRYSYREKEIWIRNIWSYVHSHLDDSVLSKYRTYQDKIWIIRKALVVNNNSELFKKLLRIKTDSELEKEIQNSEIVLKTRGNNEAAIEDDYLRDKYKHVEGMMTDTQMKLLRVWFSDYKPLHVSNIIFPFDGPDASGMKNGISEDNFSRETKMRLGGLINDLKRKKSFSYMLDKALGGRDKISADKSSESGDLGIMKMNDSTKFTSIFRINAYRFVSKASQESSFDTIPDINLDGESGEELSDFVKSINGEKKEVGSGFNDIAKTKLRFDDNEEDLVLFSDEDGIHVVKIMGFEYLKKDDGEIPRIPSENLRELITRPLGKYRSGDDEEREQYLQNLDDRNNRNVSIDTVDGKKEYSIVQSPYLSYLINMNQRFEFLPQEDSSVVQLFDLKKEIENYTQLSGEDSFFDWIMHINKRNSSYIKWPSEENDKTIQKIIRALKIVYEREKKIFFYKLGAHVRDDKFIDEAHKENDKLDQIKNGPAMRFDVEEIKRIMVGDRDSQWNSVEMGDWFI